MHAASIAGNKGVLNCDHARSDNRDHVQELVVHTGVGVTLVLAVVTVKRRCRLCPKLKALASDIRRTRSLLLHPLKKHIYSRLPCSVVISI